MSNENVTTLKLIKIYVDDISFAVNNDFQSNVNKPIDLKCSFLRNVFKIDDDNAAVVISFSIDPAATKPFHGSLKIVGLFQLEKWESSQLKRDIISINGASILFPYLRNAVSNITCLMSVPPFIIPVVNVKNLFGDN